MWLRNEQIKQVKHCRTWPGRKSRPVTAVSSAFPDCPNGTGGSHCGPSYAGVRKGLRSLSSRCPKRRDPAPSPGDKVENRWGRSPPGQPSHGPCCVLFLVRSSGSRPQESERPKSQPTQPRPALNPSLHTPAGSRTLSMLRARPSEGQGGLHHFLIVWGGRERQDPSYVPHALSLPPVIAKAIGLPEGAPRTGLGRSGGAPRTSWGRREELPGPAAEGAGRCLQGSHAEMTLNCVWASPSLSHVPTLQSTALSPTLLTMSRRVLQSNTGSRTG